MSEILGNIGAEADKFLGYRIVQAAITAAAAFLLTRVTRFIIRRTIDKNDDMKSRVETLFLVFGKCINAIIYFFAFLQICQSVFNIQPASLIAATGVVSVALGFGAQSIVKDVISGFMIIFEDQFSVGDLVTIDDFNGRIHGITLRTTLVKNIYGDVLTIPNGSITKVINHSRETRCILVDVMISYKEDIDRAMKVLNDVCEDFAGEEYITDVPEVLGVVKLDHSGVVLRVLVSCDIDTQFAAEREILRKIKYAFDNNDVTIPYTHIALVNGENIGNKSVNL